MQQEGTGKVAAGAPRPWCVLLVIGTATILTALSGSSINLALPVMGSEMSIPIEKAGVIVTSFMVTMTAFLFVSGWLGDRIGHSRMYLYGFVLFGLASLACGLAPGFGLLVGARAIQGMSGAMIMTSGPALLTTSYPPEQRGRALGMLSTATYVGLTAGPFLGGMVLGTIGWRWIFLSNVPTTAIVLALGWVLLPRDAARIDPSRGLFPDPGMFRSRVFTGAVIAALGNYVAVFVPTILVPYFLEEALLESPERSGLILAFQPLVMAIVASPSGRLSDRIGTRWLSVAGLVIMSGGMLGLARIGRDTPLPIIAAWLSVMGLGTGVFISPNSSALMGSASRSGQGMASSMMAAARTIGMMLGVAMGTVVFRLAGGMTGQEWTATDINAFEISMLAASGVGILTVIPAALGGLPGSTSPRPPRAAPGSGRA